VSVRATILTVLLAAIATGNLYGSPFGWDSVKTPLRVVATLDSLYPKAKQVAWSKKKRNYRADFIYNKMNVSITLDKTGHVVQQVREISFDQLPEKVREKVVQFYKSFKVVMVLERIDKMEIDYEVQVICGKIHYILNYHPKGYLKHQYEVDKVEPFQTVN